VARLWLGQGIVVSGLPPLVQVQVKVTKKRSVQKYQVLEQDKDSVKLKTNKRIKTKTSKDIKKTKIKNFNLASKKI